MSSKGKKQSKSSLGRSTASRSPVTHCRGSMSSATEEPFNRRSLSDAASRFPYLISEAAFLGEVCSTDTSLSNGSQSIIWLSEAFMVSSSLRPGSIVSVALAASDEEPTEKFPLHNIVENTNAHFGIDVGSDCLNNVGCYFAIANVFSSSKIQKNGVRLSWGLSCTMGFPAIGRSLFIFPIGDFLSCHNGRDKKGLHLHTCRNLKLNVLPINFHDSLPTSNSSTELPSTLSSLLLKNSSPCVDVSTMKLVLNDKENKSLYEKFISHWLCRRLLLYGNLVAVPVCGRVLLFSVEVADELTSRSSSQDSIFERKSNMLVDEVERATFYDRECTVLVVEAKTKLVFSGFTSTACESSSGSTFSGGNKFEFFGGKEPSDIPILGGLSKEFGDLEEIIKFSLAHTDPLLRYTGVLLYGPPGTGKTTLALSCIRHAGARLFVVNGPEIFSQYYGESEQTLHDIFDSAKKAAPAVVFIDELDAIAPARKEGSEELSIRMVATLLKLMDDIKRSYGVLVIAATNLPDSIDTALRRPGRFDREFEIGVPSPVQRLDILHALLNNMDHSLSNTQLESLAFDTHGFVGADLASLCNEAAMTTLRRIIDLQSVEKPLNCSHTKTCAADKKCPNNKKIEEGLYHNDLNSLSSLLSELSVSSISCCSSSTCDDEEQKITAKDFEVARMKVRPSAMREVMLELPKVCWEDVGGQEEVKRHLIETVQWPQMYPNAFTNIGIPPSRGLLLIGPPGCSKTMLARAVASEAKLNFLAVKGPELFSKWVGESEKAVRSLFAKARANSPAIIFFDEIDGLAVTRGAENDGLSVADRVLSQFLVEMDGIDEGARVIVIAATNRPDKIDPALLRPGRFDMILNVPPPDESDREDIFRVHTRGVPCRSDVSLKELACLTTGYTGADIKLACREAATAALEENLCISELSMEHFRIGIGRVRPSEVDFYQKLAEQFRRC